MGLELNKKEALTISSNRKNNLLLVLNILFPIFNSLARKHFVLNLVLGNAAIAVNAFVLTATNY